MDDRWADIVKEGFDMGVRLGNKVAKEMIAVPISAPLKMVLVASPDYLAQHGSPKNIDDCSSTALSARSSPPNTARKFNGNSNTKKS